MSRSVKKNGVLSVIQKTCHILIPLIIFPYLTRVLGADNFGKFNFANSVISYFLLFAMLGSSSYAVREGARIRDDREKLSKFVSEVFSINLLSGCLSFAALFLLIFLVPKLRLYSSLLCILSITIPATVFGRDYINTIFEDYLYITVRYIIIQMIGVVLVFALVHKPEHYVLYTLIYAFTASFGYCINLAYTRRYVPIRFTARLNLSRHIVPILILFCGHIATTIYIQSDITMVGIYLNDFHVGVYSFASKIYLLSKTMINALTIVAIPRIVYYLGKNDLDRYHRFSSKLFDYLFSLAVPFAVGLFLLGNQVIYVIGGKEYLSGTSSLKVLSIALLLAVFSGYFCNAILVPNRKEKQYLYVTILSAVVNIGLNFILIPRIGIQGAAVTTLISEFVVVLLASFSCKGLLSLRPSVKNLVLTVIGSALIAVICYVVPVFLDSYIMQIIVATSASVVSYLILHLAFKNQLYYQSFVSVVNKFRES